MHTRLCTYFSPEVVRYLVQLEASRSHLSIFCPSSFRTTSTEIAWVRTPQPLNPVAST